MLSEDLVTTFSYKCFQMMGLVQPFILLIRGIEMWLSKSIRRGKKQKFRKLLRENRRIVKCCRRSGDVAIRVWVNKIWRSLAFALKLITSLKYINMVMINLDLMDRIQEMQHLWRWNTWKGQFCFTTLRASSVKFQATIEKWFVDITSVSFF